MIHKNIKESHTLPSYFYRSETSFKASIGPIFENSWMYVGDRKIVDAPGSVYPFTLMEGVIDEPLLLSNDKKNKLRCLSNVCTHRGKIIVESAGQMPLLRCGYHGRCFRLDGSFKSTPGFEDAENFPAASDDLSEIPLREKMGLLFASLSPTIDFDELLQPITERLSWLPLDQLVYMEALSKDYFIDAHWALYCDNYLEGFHIPFVHPALNDALDGDAYSYELFRYCNLQLGIAKAGETCFDLPESSIDYGKKVLAYYFWVFPNLMFNFYPWGLSLNIVQPLAYNKTKISFRTYYYSDQVPPKQENESILNQTELEDEAVVESVQKGIQSRFYQKGRFSPSMEQGVHHFHQLIAKSMKF